MAFFANDPLVAQFSPIRLGDLTDVRRVIDVVRSSAGLGGYAWSDVSGASVSITAAQVNQFKTALAAVSVAFGLPDYNPPDVTPGSPIDAARFNTLHEFLK